MLVEFLVILLVELTLLILIILAVKWEKFNLFFHKKYTYFDIVFAILYFLEQAIFLITSYFYQGYIFLLVGFFALVVLTTVSLQGIMMESKIRKANEKLEDYNKEFAQKISIIQEKYENNIHNLRERINNLEETKL